MAVKTHLTKSDMMTILAEYTLGTFQDTKPIAAGTVQTNFWLQTTTGQYVLKYYENRPAQSVRFEANLVQYLQHRRFPCPPVFRNRHGNLVSFYHDKPLLIFAFVEGQPVDEPTPHQRQQIIQTAATLQNITSRYRPRLRAHRWNYEPGLCLTLARAEAEKADTENGWRKVQWFEDELARLELPRELPKGICHADYDLSNVLFDGDQLTALLDFDDANYTYLAFDLVNLIDGWAWPHTGAFEPEQARQIAATYTQIRPLNTLEKRHVFDVHKLQIMFDAIWFFARGQADDFYEKRKIEHLDAMGREAYTQALFA